MSHGLSRKCLMPRSLSNLFEYLGLFKIISTIFCSNKETVLCFCYTIGNRLRIYKLYLFQQYNASSHEFNVTGT